MPSYSTSVRSSIKWFKKIAIKLLTGRSVVNAYYLYNTNKDGSDKESITEYKENLCLKPFALAKNNEKNPTEDCSLVSIHKYLFFIFYGVIVILQVNYLVCPKKTTVFNQ